MAIVAVVAVAATLIWWTSDARATVSRPAASPVPALKVADAVPASLKQLWTAPSPKTTRPVVVAGSVVTGDGRQVDGRDPVTGAVLWSYARDADLCGLTSVYQDAVAVYPDARGCGQVSTIDGKTGRRDATRTSYSDAAVHLSSDGTTVLSYGAQPTRTVALRHGPHAELGRAGCPHQTQGARPTLVPAGLGGGQPVGGVGARILSGTDLAAADVAARRQGRRRAAGQVRAPARTCRTTTVRA